LRVPKPTQVQAAAGEGGDVVDRPLPRIGRHGRMLGRARPERNTRYLEWPAAGAGTYVAGGMRPGGRTPEELESLLEDAFVTRDAEALRAMFEDGGVLIAGDARREARGGAEIARLARTLWERDRTYVAEPLRVVQARGTALVLGGGRVA